MKIHTIAGLICGLGMIVPAFADTITLKDGTKLEGVVLREDKTHYVIEVKIGRSKTIKDERVIAKADVADIEKEEPAQTAFAMIKPLIPTPDLLASEEYARRIRAVTKFLRDYPVGSNTKEAKQILSTLKEEANEVLAGGIKFNGKIIAAEEYKTNAYEIDARIQEMKIRRLIGEVYYLQALRAFSTFERDFRNTPNYRALLPLINQVMTIHLAEVNDLLATLDDREKERNVGLGRMSAIARRSTENAIRDEAAECEALFKNEKDAKIGWVTIHPFYKPALDETVQFGTQEVTRLVAAMNAPVVDAAAAYRNAMMLIQSKGATPAAITVAIAAAKTALVPQRYLAKLEAAR